MLPRHGLSRLVLPALAGISIATSAAALPFGQEQLDVLNARLASDWAYQVYYYYETPAFRYIDRDEQGRVTGADFSLWDHDPYNWYDPLGSENLRAAYEVSFDDGFRPGELRLAKRVFAETDEVADQIFDVHARYWKSCAAEYALQSARRFDLEIVTTPSSVTARLRGNGVDVPSGESVTYELRRESILLRPAVSRVRTLSSGGSALSAGDVSRAALETLVANYPVPPTRVDLWPIRDVLRQEWPTPNALRAELDRVCGSAPLHSEL